MKPFMQKCAGWLGAAAAGALLLSLAGFAAAKWLVQGDAAQRINDIAGYLLAAAAALGVLTAAAMSLSRIWARPRRKKRRR